MIVYVACLVVSLFVGFGFPSLLFVFALRAIVRIRGFVWVFVGVRGWWICLLYQPIRSFYAPLLLLWFIVVGL